MKTLKAYSHSTMRTSLFQQQAAAPLFLILTTITCIGIYWTGLYGPLLLDDVSNLGRILVPDFGTDAILPNLFNDNGLFKRPVAMISFILNGLTTNDLFYWKLTNLIIHLCSGILLYFLTSRLLRIIDTENNFLAVLIAALWILHPLQVSTILYTVQRMTELSALFTFAAILTYIIARERQTRGLTAWPLQIVTWLILFPLGLFSKENALLLPAFIILIEVFSFNRRIFDNQILLKHIFLASAFVLVVALFSGMGDWVLRGYTNRNFTLLERLYTEGNVLIAYLGMLLIPAQRRMGFVHDDFPISQSLLQPWTTLPSIAIILALIFFSFFFRKKYPLISFGILFYFLGHAMESTVLGLELMYEHRNYLPSFGIFLAAASTTKEIIKNKTTITVFSAALFSLLIFTTYLRADTWSSTQRLYFHMEMVHPNSERLGAIKAAQYVKAGNFASARKRLENFSSMGADLHRLNIDCIEYKGLTDQQFSINFGHAKKADNYAVLQLTNLANRGLDNECAFSPESFIELISNISSLSSTGSHNRQIILMYKSHFLWRDNKQEEALKTLNNIFLSNDKNPTPLFLACEWMLDSNRIEKAKGTCGKALKVADSAPFDKYKHLANKARSRLNLLPTKHID